MSGSPNWSRRAELRRLTTDISSPSTSAPSTSFRRPDSISTAIGGKIDSPFTAEDAPDLLWGRAKSSFAKDVSRRGPGASSRFGNPAGGGGRGVAGEDSEGRGLHQGGSPVLSPPSDSPYPPTSAYKPRSRLQSTPAERGPSLLASSIRGLWGSWKQKGLPGNGGSPSKRHLPRWGFSRHSNRGRLLLLLVAVGVLWWLWGRGSVKVERERLTTRWWLNDAAVKNPALLPLPPMPPKPPPPKEVVLTSHSLSQLSRLTSTFSSTSPPDWTALVHLTSTSQLALLPSLLPSLLLQTTPPDRILLLAPSGFDPALKPYGPSVALLSYPTSRPPALAILLASGNIPTDFLLVVDAHLDSLHPSYISTLLRASGTKEYGSALLSAGGLVLPLSPAPSSTGRRASATCLVADGADTALTRTAPIHAPSTPFLLQTTWLAALTQGLRTDVPLEVAIALALWTKAGIPSFALPVADEVGRRDWGCEKLKRSVGVGGAEEELGRMFKRDQGGGEGIRREAMEETGRGRDARAQDGAIVLLLSGDDELALAHPLACGFASGRDVRVFVADSASAAEGPHVFFPSADASSGGSRCHLDVHPLGRGTRGQAVPLLVGDEFGRLADGETRIDVVLFLEDGGRGREFAEGLKMRDAVFGPRRGGKRRGKQMAERKREEGGAVVISLEKADMAFAEWISALPMEALRHWHTPKIDLSVITNNRAQSLSRLLTSLQSAHYFGDDVSLSLNLEQTADLATQRAVDGFAWEHGSVTVRHRILLGGLMPAVVESWYPASNDSYGVFLEDDVEVSPFFYAWLKLAILNYRYTPALRERSTRMFGISLYQQKNIELRPEGRQPFDAHKLFASLALPPTVPYLSQIPCSWGAAYFPEVWREFHAYLALRLSETALPIGELLVPEIRSNRWPRSWKKYFIELVFLRGYVMLYPNYAGFASFSTNHLEVGTHIKGLPGSVDLKKKAQFEVPLMDRSGSILDLPGRRLPPWDALPLLDLWGAIATDEEVIARGWQTAAALESCAPFSLEGPPTYEANELLCRRRFDKPMPSVAILPLFGRMPEMVQHPGSGVVAGLESEDGELGEEDVDAKEGEEEDGEEEVGEDEDGLADEKHGDLL